LLGFGGLGLLVLSDKVGSGLFRTNTVGIAPSMRVFTGQKSVLQAGIMVSYNQKMLNWDGLVYSDQLHSRYGNIYTTDFSIPDRNKVTYPDFSFGGVYRYQNNRPGTNDFQATFGLGVHHAFEPNESFMNLNSRLPRKLVIHGDFVIELGQLGSGFRKSKYSGSLKINPAFIYEKQKEFASFTAGVNGFYENVFGGLWFRNQAADLFQTNTFIINAGIYFPFNEETNIKVMYSYDLLALNELRTAAKGTHEVSLVWEFGEFSLFGGRNSGPRNFSSGDRGFECSPFD
jgi:type IX secretion system PorP/SprF family membrane protein